jgi:hypothetical protein
MSKTTVNQPARYQGNSVATKYINKVEFGPDGALTVTATAIVKPNLLPESETLVTTVDTSNQIVNKTKSPAVTIKSVPTSTVTDPQGIVVIPQPPGLGTQP